MIRGTEVRLSVLERRAEALARQLMAHGHPGALDAFARAARVLWRLQDAQTFEQYDAVLTEAESCLAVAEREVVGV
jgi:hypothetical protein